MVFPIVMHGCESWTIKKAEHRKIDAFELWCWRRLLRVRWTIWRLNQSILRGISSEYSLEGLMLKLKLQYFGHLMWRTDSLEKPWCCDRLRAGGEVDDRGWNGWMASLTWWTWIWVTLGVGDGQENLACCSPWRPKESDTTEQLNWCYQNNHICSLKDVLEKYVLLGIVCSFDWQTLTLPFVSGSFLFSIQHRKQMWYVGTGLFTDWLICLIYLPWRHQH